MRNRYVATIELIRRVILFLKKCSIVLKKIYNAKNILDTRNEFAAKSIEKQCVFQGDPWGELTKSHTQTVSQSVSHTHSVYQLSYGNRGGRIHTNTSLLPFVRRCLRLRCILFQKLVACALLNPVAGKTDPLSLLSNIAWRVNGPCWADGDDNAS